MPSDPSRMRFHALPYAEAVFLKMAGILMVYFAPDAQPITSSVSSPPVVEPQDERAVNPPRLSLEALPQSGDKAMRAVSLQDLLSGQAGTLPQRLLHAAGPRTTYAVSAHWHCYSSLCIAGECWSST